MNIGERIKIIRVEKSLSLNKLAEKSGVSPAYLSTLENGKQNSPSLVICVNLANALDISLMELLGEEVKPFCENCFFFNSLDRFQGTCDRFPPTVPPETPADVYHRHPIVMSTNWCGEWKPKKFNTGDS